MKKRTAALLLSVFITSLLCACTPPVAAPSAPKAEQYYEYFDTVSVVYSYAGDGEDVFSANCSAVEDVISRYHRLFDIYYEYSGINNLRTVNTHAGIAPVTVSEELIDFLEYGMEIYRKTNGETNIMIGAVTRLWHDCREEALRDPEAARIPTEGELAEARAHTSPELLVINREEKTVYITDPEASLDVGALGKGYAAQRASEALRARGALGYVLNLGGNIVTIGTKPTGEGWRTSIRDPHSAGEYALTVTLSDICCVTSGNYERYYVADGKRYHHIVDKDTLMPSEFFSSVTVLSDDSALADALSTALFCMPYEEGRALVDSIPGTEAFWIDNDGGEYMTDGFAARITK